MCDYPIIDIADIIEELEVITQPLDKQGYTVDILHATYDTQTLTLECEIGISKCGIYTTLAFHCEKTYDGVFITVPALYVQYNTEPITLHKTATIQLRSDLKTHNSMYTLSESTADILKDILTEKPQH